MLLAAPLTRSRRTRRRARPPSCREHRRANIGSEELGNDGSIAAFGAVRLAEGYDVYLAAPRKGIRTRRPRLYTSGEHDEGLGQFVQRVGR
jgi:hypothetical protein